MSTEGGWGKKYSRIKEAGHVTGAGVFHTGQEGKSH